MNVTRDGKPIEQKGRVRLLLVDDSKADALLLMEGIEDASSMEFTVQHVEHLQAAVDSLDTEAFDVLLLDLMLPDSTGFETFIRMHSYASQIPVIVITGSNDDSLALRCVRAGAQDFLVKDEITPQIVVRTMRHAIERFRLVRELEQMAELFARRSPALAKTLKRVESTGLQRENISVDSCIDSALTRLGSLPQQARARLARKDLPLVHADEKMIAEAYMHLIRNAIKFTRTASPQIEFTAEAEGDRWVLGVRDNGIGLAKRFHESIFDPFVRVHGQHIYPGSGIGLAICRVIVERHGGRIWVESEPGRGSHFKFTVEAVAPETGGDTFDVLPAWSECADEAREISGSE